MSKRETDQSWRPVVGFESHYEVSNGGQVRRVMPAPGARVGKILRENMVGDGRPMVHLCVGGERHGRLIHRLVLEAFCGPRPPDMECRHLNGNPQDNRWPENIEWATRAQNMADTVAHGTSTRGERNPRARLTRGSVRVICRLAARGRVEQRRVAEYFKVSRSSVCLIASGKSWGWATEDIRA